MQWFDLASRIIRVIFLSSAYASFIVLVFYFMSKKTQNKWLNNRMNHKFRNWLLLHFVISTCLFLYSFSYWQDTGLGEAPSLPIGYGQRIYYPDFAWTTFYPDLNKTELNRDELQIENFIIKNNVLCAEISHRQANSPRYDFIVCDLAERTSKTFRTEVEYADYARINGLPMKSEFYDFETHYKKYFDKQPQWKKWLLP
jgi:heme/copper-type cytochrome/quinol oxidase subunit 2